VGGTGIEVNRRNGHLYNVNTGAANLSVLDGNTNGVIDTIGLGADPFAIAINNSTGTIFVGLRESGRLVKLEE
jgi:YVTN family beta-propeller protein